MSEPMATDAPSPAVSPAGVGGWLAVFCVGAGLNIALGIVRLVRLAHAVPHIRDASARQLGVLQSAALAPVLPLMIVGLWWIWHRHPRTRQYWLVATPVTYALVLLYAVLGRALLNRAAELGAAVSAVTHPDIEGNMVLTVVAGMIWTSYWYHSKRVRNTFTSPDPVKDD